MAAVLNEGTLEEDERTVTVSEIWIHAHAVHCGMPIQDLRKRYTTESQCFGIFVDDVLFAEVSNKRTRIYSSLIE